jgi:hypothetical protein
LTSFENPLIIPLKVVLKTTFKKLIDGRPELDISGDMYFSSSNLSNHSLQVASTRTEARLIEHFSKYYSHMRTGELLVRAARAVRAIGVPSLPVSLARI